jgi:hypothetical protein
MEEETILAFRNKAVKYFERVLHAEGHDLLRATELAFFIAKVLEDTHSLVEDVEADNPETHDVYDHIHMLYTNVDAFIEGHKILMYKN